MPFTINSNGANFVARFREWEDEVRRVSRLAAQIRDTLDEHGHTDLVSEEAAFAAVHPIRDACHQMQALCLRAPLIYTTFTPVLVTADHIPMQLASVRQSESESKRHNDARIQQQEDARLAVLQAERDQYDTELAEVTRIRALLAKHPEPSTAPPEPEPETTRPTERRYNLFGRR